MAYVPKTRKVNVKLWIPVIVIVIALSSFGAYYFMQNKEEEGKYSICGFSQKDMQKKMKKEYANTYMASDFVYYGESLNILQAAFNPDVNDALAGKSILLKDICSDNEYAFVIGSQADRGVLLSSLQDGFYEIFVVEDLIEKRIVFDKEVMSEFQTIHRNDGKSKKTTLLANTTMFSDSEVTLPLNYSFIEVKQGKEKQYDVVLDPAGMDHDFTYTLNKGAQGNGLSENSEMYAAATFIKEKLEEKGLKVLITKKSEDEVVESYGKDGRLERAYDAKAKYYIRLSFAKTESGLEGMEVSYSAHASSSFANQILYELSRNTNVTLSNDAGIVNGLYECYPWEGIDKRRVYDNDLWIREAGGKVTQAGMYSENAIKGNTFAKDNLYGMNTISINMGYITNEKDATFYKENKEAFLTTISNAILKYLNVEE